MTKFMWISALSLFGSVAALVYWTLKSTNAAYQRGREILAQLEINPAAEVAASSWLSRFSKVGVYFIPLVKQLAELNRFGAADILLRWQHQLVRGGLGNRLTATQLMSASFASALALGLGGCALLYLGGVGFFGIALFGFIPGAVGGFLLPAFIIRSLADERIALIEKRLPFAIEFMLLALDASASFPLAMGVYCRQMTSDPLADELRVVAKELDEGLGLRESLRRMNARLDSEPVSTFLLAVATGLENGTPVKDVLKTQADVTRQRRYKSAEEVAKTAGTRALFPLILSMIGVFLLMLGPMGLKLMWGGIF
jgi:Flp pilus assembly protein TadB